MNRNELTVAENRLWVVHEKGTEDHWLELRDPNGWYKAVVRFDGCIHFDVAGNVPFFHEGETLDRAGACDDYIHICDIDEHIKRLVALKEEAIKFFGEGWLNK